MASYEICANGGVETMSPLQKNMTGQYLSFDLTLSAVHDPIRSSMCIGGLAFAIEKVGRGVFLQEALRTAQKS